MQLFLLQRLLFDASSVGTEAPQNKRLVLFSFLSFYVSPLILRIAGDYHQLEAWKVL
jgi:hypothetical protein